MISLITPHADRPEAMRLCERWISAQTVKPDQWIVADGGMQKAELTMGQLHIHLPQPSGVENFIGNVLAAIPHVEGDAVIMIENDDAYLPNHIEVCVDRLKKTTATGCTTLRYYNVQFRAWRTIRNSCAALCNTAFRREHLPDLEAAAMYALSRNEYHVDRRFWDRVGTAGLHSQDTVIGIKGMPGSQGIGIGHQNGPAWRIDRDGAKLREWLGSDAEAYQL